MLLPFWSISLLSVSFLSLKTVGVAMKKSIRTFSSGLILYCSIWKILISSYLNDSNPLVIMGSVFLMQLFRTTNWIRNLMAYKMPMTNLNERDIYQIFQNFILNKNLFLQRSDMFAFIDNKYLTICNCVEITKCLLKDRFTFFVQIAFSCKLEFMDELILSSSSIYWFC